MESAESSGLTKPRVKQYRFYARVVRIFEHFILERIDKDGTRHEKSAGWWVLFDGSRQSEFVSMDRPDFTLGDKILITYQKVPDAKPSGPSV